MRFPHAYLSQTLRFDLRVHLHQITELPSTRLKITSWERQTHSEQHNHTAQAQEQVCHVAFSEGLMGGGEKQNAIAEMFQNLISLGFEDVS